MSAFPVRHGTPADRGTSPRASGLARSAACGSVPNVEPVINQSANAGAKPQLAGARGPLSAEQSKAILDKLRAQAPDSDVLQRHLAIEEAIAESPLVVGNRTRILRDGAATFRAMFAAIRGARDHVNLEYYIVEDVESDGEHLGDLLLAKRAKGVQVNIIYDSYGSNATPAAFFKRLKEGGINVVDFNPVNPLEANSVTPDDRDHRKILVVDGATAIVGGVNLSATYEVQPARKIRRDRRQTVRILARYRPADRWTSGGPAPEAVPRALDRAEGPAARRSQFLSHRPAEGQRSRSRPRQHAQGCRAALLRDHALGDPQCRAAHLDGDGLFRADRRRRSSDLVAAARRGVDVRLLLPGESDSDLALTVGRSNYRELLEGGVKIYETRNEILHSKAAVVDGVWTIIGSSNFDRRSVIFNDEVDSVVLGRETGQQMEAMFEDDFKQATPIDLATWKDRPLPTKIKEIFYNAWQNQL